MITKAYLKWFSEADENTQGIEKLGEICLDGLEIDGHILDSTEKSIYASYNPDGFSMIRIKNIHNDSDAIAAYAVQGFFFMKNYQFECVLENQNAKELVEWLARRYTGYMHSKRGREIKNEY